MSRRDSPRGRRSSPPNGRTCCAQPIGESHESQALVTRVPAGSTVPSMLPTPLSANVTPRAPAQIPVAPRPVADNWTATAATPMNTRPTAPTDAPTSTDPVTGNPFASTAAASPPARARSATAAATTAATSPAYRPTTVAPSSSARPSSSFCRVCRTTTKVHSSAASTANVTNSRCNM